MDDPYDGNSRGGSGGNGGNGSGGKGGDTGEGGGKSAGKGGGNGGDGGNGSAGEPLQPDLKANLDRLRHILQDCSDIVFHTFSLKGGRNALLVYTEGIVDSAETHLHMLMPLLFLMDPYLAENGGEDVATRGVSLSQMERIGSVEQAVEAILTSSVLLLVDGYAGGAVFNVKGGVRRGVQEPNSEVVIRGPREGFTENLRVNTALLRFKIKSPDLKMVRFVKGTYTRTDIVLAYIDGVADRRVVQEARRRIEAIEINSVLESGYIEELIEDHPNSPFPQLQYTERPDTVAGQLLEGRFAILVDGTPFVMIGPITLWQLLQASEDYYERYFISNLIRWLRFAFALIALYLPALYVAVITFHPDMLPTTLLLSVAAAREAIPFPALVEALIMEVSFEALREAGIRLPKTVGQAVSILGALVIGQAAVEAGIVSAPVVIIVSLTGIASFTIPRFSLAIAIRILRFVMIFAGAAFGLFGLVIATIIMVAHMCNLNSFGVPYLSGVAPFRGRDQQDIFIRAPWARMNYTSGTYSQDNQKRTDKSTKQGIHESW
jgi:spore germination protein KA